MLDGATTFASPLIPLNGRIYGPGALPQRTYSARTCFQVTASPPDYRTRYPVNGRVQESALLRGFKDVEGG